MERDYYLKLAADGLRIPIAADLVLHQKSNPEEILSDGVLLGKVLAETAEKYNVPFAIPLMDLSLEITIMLKIIGVKDKDIGTFHFDSCPDSETIARIKEQAGKYLTERMKANIEAVKYISEHTDLIPVGMSIGPFSLLTKLIADPITAVYLSGSGVTAEDDDEIKMLEVLLDLSLHVIIQYIELKIRAGAKVILIAEPAANLVYFSPKQIEEGADVFDRYAIELNKRIKSLLDQHNVDLIFHCCGELNDMMLKKFAELDPSILTLGGSRILWKDAEIIPKDIVLFGNLPSKKFYSDDEITVDEVIEKSRELIENMKTAGHPFILGTECDVLFVDGAEDKINAKVNAMMNC